MTLEIAILLGLILLMVVLFISEMLPPDAVAMSMMVILILAGFVTPQEGISGLSNRATITVLALMILSVGLETTGVITQIGQTLRPLLEKSPWKTTLTLMLIVGFFSAFISTTAVVVVFLRIVVRLSRTMPVSLSKVLMPLSFAGILGGSCTLLGTSTNLLVSAIAKDYDLQPFGVFEFSHIGLLFFGVATLYMVLAGRHLLPSRRKPTSTLAEDYSISEYFAEVQIQEHSPLNGKRVRDTELFQDEEIDLVQVQHMEETPHFPRENEFLRAGDTLLVKGHVENIASLMQRNGLTYISRPAIREGGDISTEDAILCEVLIRPKSRLVGRKLNKVTIQRDYDAIPLAIHKHKQYVTSHLRDVRIEAGDTILMAVGKVNFRSFYNSSEFVVLQDHDDLAQASAKAPIAIAIMIAVVATAAVGLIPIVVSSLAGCVAMLITGCLDLQRAYRRVDWSVIFLLAGVIPLGVAMDNTGASTLVADSFISTFGDVSPRMLIGVLFITTALCSAVISNNATAILLAPIVVSIAYGLAIDPRPLLLTVMFAANMSFVSPIGYQTNMLIFGPGEYRFTDFVRTGGILTLILWGVATWVIPMVYFE